MFAGRVDNCISNRGKNPTMKRLLVLIGLVALALSCWGCRSGPANENAANTAATPERKTDSISLGLAAYLPNHELTPGDTLDVTKDDICTPGYSRKVRDVPEAVKKEAYERYGITSHQPHEYEVDHLISLELGGSNSIKNLWPESYQTEPWNAHVKDALENHLHKLVCDRQLDLKTAQQEIATDWIAAYKKYLGEPGQEKNVPVAQQSTSSRESVGNTRQGGRRAAFGGGDGASVIVGNKHSKIYHRPDCPDYGRVSAENRVEFSSVEEAEKAGYRAAQNCPH